MPDNNKASNSPEEEISSDILPRESFRNLREQEAENIRQEYVRRTGRLPLLRPKESSDGTQPPEPEK